MKKLLMVFAVLFAFNANAYGDCSNYGYGAYYDGVGCKCMSGYMWDEDYSSNPYCVSGTTYCYDKFGFNSQYNLLSGSCECRSGYVVDTGIFGNQTCKSGESMCYEKFGLYSNYDSYTKSCECDAGYILSNNNQCIKQKTSEEICRESLGLFSHYNSLYDICECSSGYVIDKSLLGIDRCVYGDTVCSSKYGLYSDYNSSTKSCECDDGYTFNDNNQCVKKQNNVYFTLKELDASSREAVIKSKYDNKNYKILYGTGCLSSTIDNYLNKDLVVNLGTDYNLDAWDTIVLQNDDQTCDIVSKTSVANDFTLEDNKGTVLSATDVTAGMKKFIPEGALIKAKDNPDIYIVKYVGDKWFKRLVLSPSVFNNYGHLKWENVLTEDQSALNAYVTSSLVRAVGDDKVYMLYPQGDTGEKRQIKDNSIFSKMGLDQESIYVINAFDRDSYITGKLLE